MKLTGSSYNCTGSLSSKYLSVTGSCWLFNKVEQGGMNHQQEQLKWFKASFDQEKSPCALKLFQLKFEKRSIRKFGNSADNFGFFLVGVYHFVGFVLFLWV